MYSDDREVPTSGLYWPWFSSMPYPQPGSLTTQEVYAVTAYVLYLNGIVAEDSVLDQGTLPKVRMPNRDGFVTDPRNKHARH